MAEQKTRARRGGTPLRQVMREELDRADSVVENADADEGMRLPTLLLSNGIRVRLQPVPPYLLGHVAEQVPMPSVPTFFNEDKGTEEENPSDPDYQNRVNEALQERVVLMLDALYMRGIEVVSVPQHIPAIEDDAWIEDAEELGIKGIPREGRKRRLAWFKMVALTTSYDINHVTNIIMRLIGLSEEDVLKQLDLFRGLALRGTDNSVPA